MPIQQQSRGGLAMLLAIAFVACRGEPAPDAYGHLEAVETVVSSQTTGQLARFTAMEGQHLDAGASAAVVDTSALVLQLQQVVAQRAVSAARVSEAGHQIGGLRAQEVVARRAYERTRRLADLQAATAQQLDQSERDYRTLVAQRSAAGAQREGAEREAVSTEARAAQLRDQIAKSRVSNPVAGTVITTYARQGEFVQAGQPLYRIANLDTMELRAYVTEPQLAGIRIGGSAQVTVDAAESRRVLSGTVVWVSSRAEFTPTPIQTRDERTNLVYAVRLRVPNRDGLLKIGMPADVELYSATASR